MVRENKGDFAIPSKNPIVCILIGILFTASAAFLGIVCLPFIVVSSDVTTGGWDCESTEQSFQLVNSQNKGMNIDDETLQHCFDKTLALWPNTGGEKIKVFRMFRAWDDAWEGMQRDSMWNHLKDLLEANDAQLLLGTSVSCDPAGDKQVWEWAKQLMTKLGRNRILAIAVGNEMELLYQKKDVPHIEQCVEMVWDKPNNQFPVHGMPARETGGYFSWVFKQYVEDIETLGDEWKDMQFTTVMGGGVLDLRSSPPGSVIINDPEKALFQNWVEDMVMYFQTTRREVAVNRFVWVLNNYPFWQPSNDMDTADPSKCHDAQQQALDLANGEFANLVGLTRNVMSHFNFQANAPLWVGETGWSSPVPSEFIPPVSKCTGSDGWFSLNMFKSYYQNFLKWDMNIPGQKVDKIFYFSMRNSNNFGTAESFGLVPTCDKPVCKIQADAPPAQSVLLDHLASSDNFTRETV